MRTFVLPTLCLAGPALAADHAEAPGAGADSAADIADFYAFVDGDTFVGVLTFAGLTPAGGEATYDADVLYTMHIDQDGDNISDVDVHVRFAQNAAGDWGVQATGIPAASAPLEGPVETATTEGQYKLWAGLRDDPFFFDLQGFNETLATGTISFDSTRDSLAGVNVTAIVLEGPAATFSGGATTFTTWATTARK